MNGKFLNVRGRRMFVRDEGAGRPLLLVHGFPLDHSMWSGQWTLADRYRLIAPDLPGFGQCELPQDDAASVLSMERLADDLAALAEALGIAEPLTFCGLSMGGYVAWQFWKRHRDRLAGLILCDTRSVADSAEAAEGRRRLAAQAIQSGAEVVASAMAPKLFSAETAARQPQLVEQIRQTMLSVKPATLSAALLGMAQRPDMTASLKEIDTPAVVICGQHDVISPPAEMQGIAAAMPRATFELIPGAGHMAPLEAPGKVNAAIARFLG